MIVCPTCRSQNEDGAAFCDQCGGPLGGLAPQPVAPAIQPSMPPMQPAVGGGNSCPACGAAVIPGEAFCDSCGAALSNAVPVQSGIPSIQPPMPPVMPLPVMPPPVMPPVAPAAVARLIASNGQTYTLSGKSSYIVGREDAVSGVYPDVDTTPSGGEEGGVGRRHLEISQNGSQWFIKDLNSTNGTWVNNQRLAANVPLPLSAGAQIRLGRWTATFQM